MPSHFSTIGIPLSSQEDFMKYVEWTIKKGKPIKTKLGTYAKYDMGNGVELWGQLNSDNEIIGVNPHFSGSAKLTARLVSKVNDPDDSELDGRIYAEAEPGADGAGERTRHLDGSASRSFRVRPGAPGR